MIPHYQSTKDNPMNLLEFNNLIQEKKIFKMIKKTNWPGRGEGGVIGELCAVTGYLAAMI